MRSVALILCAILTAPATAQQAPGPMPLAQKGTLADYKKKEQDKRECAEIAAKFPVTSPALVLDQQKKTYNECMRQRVRSSHSRPGK